ncbi:hypothetical protein BDW71DRAFT_181703, partial [Aspergillus fruticulosus]
MSSEVAPSTRLLSLRTPSPSPLRRMPESAPLISEGSAVTVAIGMFAQSMDVEMATGPAPAPPPTLHESPHAPSAHTCGEVGVGVLVTVVVVSVTEHPLVVMVVDGEHVMVVEIVKSPEVTGVGSHRIV